MSPSSVDAQVTATDLGGTGTGRSSSSYAFQYPTSGNAGFMQFTLTAEAGKLLELETLNFLYYFPQTSGTNVPVTATFSLHYSLDGFATAGTALTSPQAGYTSTSGANDASVVIGDFSPASYDLGGIAPASSIAFRIILANDGALNTSAYRYAVDNLAVLGNVVAGSGIPEPAAFGLVAGMAGLAAIGLRRRSRR